ncbi:NUDIX hydrolase [Phaeovulum vinaykumarii]|uniref:8-oxo-dGTP pyrophosphatase MutT, NUDIX family n=1 Tax=Phaeovulum vinaykumarii TaxID=407234 RepID=A0A1N7KVP0_9RHOB|nr:NUDIX hydrolase [Phaeovulum vinaykumarii]SIS65556.1 8-oxo-dGTP pyrophosphatase MutT, NUDIX family [Phaeovulum vinaykumarii]SOC01244.1 8-oxo-dGTP pyrophosphatase MutT (NUDIX family) [Phaeovulum vinaykumarii]
MSDSASTPSARPDPTARPRADALRDAASVLVLRRDGPGPRVLMGQRGAGAAFMPSKYVFPGGAVDAGDGAVALAAPLPDACAARLAQELRPDARPDLVPALAVAAIRELWEETGLALGCPGAWPGTPPEDWRGFAGMGLRPSAAALRFVFRAITPPGRPRRFDARFFMLDVAELASDPDDFSRACDELSHLHWVGLDQARALNLPFITEVVLAEVAELVAASGSGPLCPPETVAFFDNSGAARFARLGAPS